MKKAWLILLIVCFGFISCNHQKRNNSEPKTIESHETDSLLNTTDRLEYINQHPEKYANPNEKVATILNDELSAEMTDNAVLFLTPEYIEILKKEKYYNLSKLKSYVELYYDEKTNLRKETDVNFLLGTFESHIHDFNDDAQPDTIFTTNDNEIILLLSSENQKEPIRFSNHRLLQQPQYCPNKPLRGVITNDKYFTIEKYNCSQEYYMEEYVTFKLSGNLFLLYKYRVVYTDRKDPDKIIPEKTWTEKDFGALDFENLTQDFLTNMRNN